MNPLAIFTGPYALLAKWGVIATLVAAFYFFAWYRGDEHGTQKLTDHIGKEATETVRIAKGRDTVTEKVVTQYVKVKGATSVITEKIEREVLVYANAGNCLDAAWGSLHDNAALHAVPDPGFKPDAAAGAPTAAAALQTVTANYAACWRNADRLEALQSWVSAQQGVK